MKITLLHSWFRCNCALVLTVMLSLIVTGQEVRATEEPNLSIPVSGIKGPKVELFDAVMVKYLNKIGCTTATLAISKEGRILYKRGYGWQDKERTIPAVADTMIGIASCGKPIDAAGIRHLARKKKFNLDGRLFDILPVEPRGAITDERIKDITLNHLLENKAGWGYDPRGPASEMARRAGFKDPLSIEILLSFIMTMPLDDAPGSTAKYCNFGWDTLFHIVEKYSGKPFEKFVCMDLLSMPNIYGMYTVGQPLKPNNPPLVWNYAEGGPISASAGTLCRFMEKYWLPGERREGGIFSWVMIGSLDGSTAFMVWRPDGINLVALFNGRKDVGDIIGDLENVIDNLQSKNITFKNNWSIFGQLHCSKTAGDTAEYVFEGEDITWLGREYDDAGKAKVEIDGKQVAVVDQYGPVRERPFRWRYKNLNPGRHKIVITILNEKNSMSKDNWLNVQKFMP